MFSVVVGVERVMRGAGVLRVALQDRRGDRAGFQRDRRAPFASRNRAEKRERIERRGFIVGWIAGDERGHADGVLVVARRLVAVAEQTLDGREISPLARSARFT